MKIKQKVGLPSAYYSFRPVVRPQESRRRVSKVWLLVIPLIFLGGLFVNNASQDKNVNAAKKSQTVISKSISKPSICVGSTDSQKIVVDISDQHVWMCNGTDEAYDAPVTTGAYMVADHATPTGTRKILAKYTKLYLSGSDSQGSWNDYVNYWLPFDGDYGFHDATWQKMPFGSSKYPTEGSHGCVRLSLETATWLYDWVNVGAVVTIRS